MRMMYDGSIQYNVTNILLVESQGFSFFSCKCPASVYFSCSFQPPTVKTTALKFDDSSEPTTRSTRTPPVVKTEKKHYNYNPDINGYGNHRQRITETTTVCACLWSTVATTFRFCLFHDLTVCMYLCTCISTAGKLASNHHWYCKVQNNKCI